MPNRILRDWTDSDRIDKLTAHAEVFFVRLIMKVDDYGRFYAEPRRLRSACYPLKDSIRDTDISRWLLECEKAGLIRCYDATGCRYVCVNNFKQRLRVMFEKYPRPPNETPADCQPSGSQTPAPLVSVSDSSEDSPKEKGSVRGKGFPVTVDDAIQQCCMVAVPKEHIVACYDKGASRGGRDARGNEIEDFPSYVRIEWKYEQDRVGRTAATAVKGMRPHEIKLVIEAKENEAAELKRRHCSDVAMGDSWDSRESRKKFFEIKSEIKKLNSQIARYGAVQAMT